MLPAPSPGQWQAQRSERRQVDRPGGELHLLEPIIENRNQLEAK